MQILVYSGLSFNAIITDMGRTEDGEYRPEAGILLIKAIRKAGINLPILVYTTLNLYARTINEVVAAGGNGATMSAEELSAWLRDYTNLATEGNIEDSLDNAIPKGIDRLPSSASVVCDRLNSERSMKTNCRKIEY